MPEPVGRPRLHDRKKIAQDFIEWAKNNPDALTVPQFATSIGLNSKVLLNWCLEDEEFRGAYNTAKEFIGINRLNSTLLYKEKDKVGLDKSIYMQTIGNYDLDVREYQRDEKRFEASLKNDDSNAISKEHIEHMEAVLNLMKSRQSSARKIEDNSNNNEPKS